MRIITLKKTIFELSVSLVLVMAAGSIALGEVQASATPKAEESTSVEAGDFILTGENIQEDKDYAFDDVNGVLEILSEKEITIKTSGETDDRIMAWNITGNLILDGVNINTPNGPALDVGYNGNGNITLKSGSKNVLKTTESTSAGLQRNGYSSGLVSIQTDDIDASGELTAIGGSQGAGIGSDMYNPTGYINIKSGKITAIGGSQGGAGVGGGKDCYSNDITINGGVVTATGGIGAAGIGGGANALSSNNNTLDGSSAAVIATSGDANKNALDGFKDWHSDVSYLLQGITFTRKSESGSWVGNIYTDSSNIISIYDDVKLWASLTLPSGIKATVGSNAVITSASGVNLTVADNAELVNNGKIPDDETLTCDGSGKVTTKTDFYRNGSDEVYKTGYQTYQTSEGVQKYANLPNPDDTTLLKNSLTSDEFLYWYYLDGTKKVPIKDGDDVFLNQHNFYEERTPEPTPPAPDPEPTPTSKEGWDLDDTGWHYFVENEAITGWKWIDDTYGAHWYFFGDDSYMVSSSWLYDQDEQSWYWVCSTGPMIENLWQWIDNAWYGFWWGGKMCQGWVWDTDWNAWFYCYQNGIMARSTWIDAYWVDWRGVWLH